MQNNKHTDKPKPDERRYQGLGFAQQLLLLVFLVIAGWYIVWRVGTFNHHALALSIAVYAAECWFMLSVLLHMFMVWRLSERKPPAPESGLSVDVFITTYNEPVSMIKRTLVAAMAMDYPHQTWLLDDGNRAEMADLAKALGCHYLPRTQNTDAKAGNLNNGLLHSHADFVAIFDADHVPNHQFLVNTLGYFRNESVAFVQCPQTFYNLDSYQTRGRTSIRWGEQALFFRVIQRGKDYWNSAMFVGTTAVLRRKALDDIGGIPTGTIAEDFHTTVKLQRQGWSSIYHDEALAFGLAAQSLRTYVRQRLRWGQGGMQVLRQEEFFMGRGLTLAQRLSNLASVLTYFDAWPRLFLYALPGIVLATGVMPINSLNLVFIAHFLPYYLLHFWVFEEMARGYGNSLYVEEYNLVRSFAFAISTFALFRGKIPFRVSDKHGSGRWSEAMLLVPHAITLLWVFVGLALGAWLWPVHNELTLGAFWANFIWAILILTIGIRAISFTLFRRQQRRDYRFEIPLPASLECDSKKEYGVVSDISSTGLGLQLPVSASPNIGEQCSGSIYLPDKIFPFQGHITHVNEGNPVFVGVAIPWDQGMPPQIESFLYSSPIQWRINAISDRVRPPIEWIFNFFQHQTPIRLRALSEQWEPLLTSNDSSASMTGLICERIHQGDFAFVGPEMNEGQTARYWRPGHGGEWIEGQFVRILEYADLAQNGLYVYRFTPLESGKGGATPMPHQDQPPTASSPSSEMESAGHEVATPSEEADTSGVDQTGERH